MSGNICRSICLRSPRTFSAALPAVVDVGDGAKVAIAESDVEDYPGLWLLGTGGTGLNATFPPYPLKEELFRDRDYKVVESADYIAVTTERALFRGGCWASPTVTPIC